MRILLHNVCTLGSSPLPHFFSILIQLMAFFSYKMLKPSATLGFSRLFSDVNLCFHLSNHTYCFHTQSKNEWVERIFSLSVTVYVKTVINELRKLIVSREHTFHKCAERLCSLSVFDILQSLSCKKLASEMIQISSYVPLKVATGEQILHFHFVSAVQ